MLGSIKHVNFEHVLFHPSQDVIASREDIEVTRRLVKCGEMMGIEVLDHLVVNEKAKFFSMKEKGHM